MKIDRNNVLLHFIKKSDELDKEEFRKYAIPLIKKIFRCNTNKAKQTVNWFLKKYGASVIKK